MAQTLNDAEFWLPPEEEEELLLMDYNKNERFSKKVFSNEWFRKLVGGLSEEDEFVNGSTLQEPNFHHSEGLKLSGSPQSTLWASIPGSGRDSPSYASRVSSPPETKGGAIGWDLLYAAAEEVARMRKFDQTAAFYSNKLSAPAPAPTLKPIMPVNVPHQNMASGFYGYKPEMGLEYQRLQVEHMKQQMMMKKVVREQTKMELQFQNGKRNEGPPGLLSSMATWPTIQQSQHQHQHHQPGSGMRAVFLNGDLGTQKKERTGTGVFLPRRFEPTTELTRKKSSGGCSVLLPDRVVHALNLNLDSMDPSTSQSHQHRCNANMAPQQYDAAFKLKNNGMMAQPRMNFRTKLPVMKNQELRLPQEWTY